MRKKNLIFVGHFDIGERYNKNTKSLVQEAKKYDDDVVVLVGDIGVVEKIVAYIQKGINAVYMLYHIRAFSCDTGCIYEQLPKSDELEYVVDIDFYKFVAKHLKKHHLGLYKSIKNNTFDRKKLIKIINNEIVPKEVEKRINAYNFTNKNVIILFEKQLRNKVSKKLINTKTNNSWRTIPSFNRNKNGYFIDNEMLINNRKNPVCRGIMFAFYEKIWSLNYENLIHLVEKRHLRSIKKGYSLFVNTLPYMPEFKNKKKKVSFITNKELKSKIMDKSKIYKLVAEKNAKRFNKHPDYVIDKLTNDDFVSNAILKLIARLKLHISDHLEYYQNLKKIKILDVGPAHGAIGTCYTLALLEDFDLLEKVELMMIDPVKNVIQDNVQMNFPVDKTFEIIIDKLYDNKLIATKDKLDNKQLVRIFSKSNNFIVNIQELEINSNLKSSIDILIYTFTLHHIHPDHKTQAMQKAISLMKTNAFFGFADEWFQEEYYERFIKGRNHIDDPIPFEFPESPEDVIEHFNKKISIYYLEYDRVDAYTITGIKRKVEEKWKTGHFPDVDYEDLV